MDIERVCSSCFEDINVRIWIRDQEGPRGCDACGKYDSPTVAFKDLCDYLEECLKGFWGFAADQLPYESAEGGYQGTTWDTSELVFDEVGLGLVRDKQDRLLHAFYRGLSSEVWCDYDWLRLDEDVALRTSWDRFCADIKHSRRFFFQARGGDAEDSDSFSHVELLRTISQLASSLGLLKALPTGMLLYRARTKISKKGLLNAATFGPPPADKALQSNRMNPPGIPMFYGAERQSTAVREVRTRSAQVGAFKTNRSLRVLDLSSLAEVPHIWSNPDRSRRLGLKFLHQFTAAIMEPVSRDERTHIEYIPSQVVTEFLRDFDFAEGRLDGIRFPSAQDARGRNVVLFLDTVIPKPVSPWGSAEPPPPLDFVGHRRVSVHGK